MSACAGKTPYLNRKAANKERKSGKTFHFYRCPQCGNYHLTTAHPRLFVGKRYADVEREKRWGS